MFDFLRWFLPWCLEDMEHGGFVVFVLMVFFAGLYVCVRAIRRDDL